MNPFMPRRKYFTVICLLVFVGIFQECSADERKKSKSKNDPKMYGTKTPLMTSRGYWSNSSTTTLATYSITRNINNTSPYIMHSSSTAFLSTTAINNVSPSTTVKYTSDSHHTNTSAPSNISPYNHAVTKTDTPSRIENRSVVTSSPTSRQSVMAYNETDDGSTKTMFVAEIRIVNLNFSAELKNMSSELSRRTALDVTNAVDSVMSSDPYYTNSEVISFREGSVISQFEIEMMGGQSNDPNIALDRLKTAVKTGSFGNLTVDRTYFIGWKKKYPEVRETLVSGQLAGIGLIVFIVVALVLVICLGKFAAEPVFEERDIFTSEQTVREIGIDNNGNEDTEWKFDPLFAWSRQTTDKQESKL